VNAQVKPNEQAAEAVRLANRRNDVFEIGQLDEGVECLLDEVCDAMPRLIGQILNNHQTLDDAETGRLIHELIGGYGLTLSRAREKRENERVADELWNEMLPSWRKAQP
jgi:hypothetical protein